MDQITLKAQTQALDEEYRRVVPKDVMDIVDKSIDDLIASGIENRCLKPGNKIPEICLPDAYGKEVNIQELLKRGPVILSFYRGGWCAFCNLELRAFQMNLELIRGKSATLVAITPQKSHGTKKTMEEFHLDYPILTDAGNEVAKQFGIVFEHPDKLKSIFVETYNIVIPEENGDDTYGLPLTATYVVDQEGRIIAAFTGADYRQRMEPVEVIESLPKPHAYLEKSY